MGDAVVVGVDGGSLSLGAARWAAAEAARRGAPLRIVLAYHWRVPAVMAPRGGLADTARQLAEMLVADVVRDVETVAPGTSIQGTAVLGRAADVLLQESGDAALLVVGTRARHRAAGIVLGSVSQQVAMHATCPVVVVRGRADPSGDVLVGIDGSESADRALDLAFTEAGLCRSGLVAVRAIEAPVAPPALGAPPLLHDTAETRRSLSAEAAAEVAAAGERHPDVRWECHGIAGDAANVLTDRSRRARLAVVGSRGHGGFTGLLLGSVGMHLLQRADCPVMIAHERPDGGPHTSGAAADTPEAGS
ncbi:universal stress protein [Dactylosporangium sp. NPDC048998]|uniref:universal stress protein n=1 Tax=Dactylosporangium sp. NPDC048998 TaxID=3363976 RepID=UPI003710AE67